MRCQAIEDADDRHAGHLLFHTENRKKGESHAKLFSSSSIQIGYPSYFNCKAYKQ
jgi:hypothetical protein